MLQASPIQRRMTSLVGRTIQSGGGGGYSWRIAIRGGTIRGQRLGRAAVVPDSDAGEPGEGEVLASERPLQGVYVIRMGE